VKGRVLFARAEQMTDLVRATETTQTEGSQAADLAQHRKDVEALLERVEKEFGDVKVRWGGTLGARARGALFELRNLAIGMVAPEITGEGIDGKPLKLSDFKGKVVVLDFWGNW
jgi:AhpC/TSA family